jgi:hypothetical protein
VVGAIVTLALAGPNALGGPPPPPALLPDRARIARGRVLGAAVNSAPIRALRRWIKLRLAPPAIRRTPPSRSDTPALPTVGRPRDAPLAAPGRVGS